MSIDVTPVDLKPELQSLQILLKHLNEVKSLAEKSDILDQNPKVKEFFKKEAAILNWMKTLKLEEEIALKELLAIGQGPVVFQGMNPVKAQASVMEEFLSNLVQLDQFYDVIGGLIGYHCAVLQQIIEQVSHQNCTLERYLKPEGIHLEQETDAVRKAIRYSIEHAEQLAEIYPVGGAGDRLDLKDEVTGEPLPSAELLFCGFTLLEGLIRDLQAREYLCYKLTGKRIVTPIVMMTSHEKDNHAHILQICERNRWFGRSPLSYFLITQPLVPVLSIEGKWVMHGPFEMMQKPGGHGVLWKLMLDSQVFTWLKSLGKSKGLVRQINNPIAGTDYGLSAFVGVGLKENKDFGFASCQRRLNASEGMDVVIEKEIAPDAFAYRLTNVEYTEFHKKGIADEPDESHGLYSKFPANTNILFVDFDLIQDLIKKQPVPGMLINMKHTVPTIDQNGIKVHVKAGRLESTMQNIADEIEDVFDHRLKPIELNSLRTYLTYNERKKTISVTKQSYQEGKPFQETPEGCFYDLLHNAYDLFKHHCGMDLPFLNSEEEMLKLRPSFLAYLHPALGPFYSVIAQKIQGGKLGKGALLQLEIAELLMQNVSIEGSLHVHAENVLGHFESEQNLQYSEQNGKCILKNVQIVNKGIDYSVPNRYWKKEILHREVCKILLKGNAEFYAEEVTLIGNQVLEVPSGHRMTVLNANGQVVFNLEPIEKATWNWNYRFDKHDKIECEFSTLP